MVITSRSDFSDKVSSALQLLGPLFQLFIGWFLNHHDILPLHKNKKGPYAPGPLVPGMSLCLSHKPCFTSLGYVSSYFLTIIIAYTMICLKHQFLHFDYGCYPRYSGSFGLPYGQDLSYVI